MLDGMNPKDIDDPINPLLFSRSARRLSINELADPAKFKTLLDESKERLLEPYEIEYVNAIAKKSSALTKFAFAMKYFQAAFYDPNDQDLCLDFYVRSMFGHFHQREIKISRNSATQAVAWLLTELSIEKREYIHHQIDNLRGRVATKARLDFLSSISLSKQYFSAKEAYELALILVGFLDDPVFDVKRSAAMTIREIIPFLNMANLAHKFTYTLHIKMRMSTNIRFRRRLQECIFDIIKQSDKDKLIDYRNEMYLLLSDNILDDLDIPVLKILLLTLELKYYDIKTIYQEAFKSLKLWLVNPSCFGFYLEESEHVYIARALRIIDVVANSMSDEQVNDKEFIKILSNLIKHNEFIVCYESLVTVDTIAQRLNDASKDDIIKSLETLPENYDPSLKEMVEPLVSSKMNRHSLQSTPKNRP